MMPARLIADAQEHRRLVTEVRCLTGWPEAHIRHLATLMSAPQHPHSPTSALAEILADLRRGEPPDVIAWRIKRIYNPST